MRKICESRKSRFLFLIVLSRIQHNHRGYGIGRMFCIVGKMCSRVWIGCLLTLSILYKVLNHLLSLVGEMVLEPTSTTDLEGLYAVAGLCPTENSSENIWD